MDDGVYFIELDKNYNNIDRIDIKPLKSDSTIQIWRKARAIEEKEPIYEYYLKATIEKALQIPTLHILNTGELDDVYENFDSVDIESLFKNE